MEYRGTLSVSASPNASGQQEVERISTWQYWSQHAGVASWTKPLASFMEEKFMHSHSWLILSLPKEQSIPGQVHASTSYIVYQTVLWGDSRKAGQCLSRPAMQKPVVAQVEPFSPFLVLCWGTHPFGTASKKNSNCSFRILLLVLLTAVLRTPAAPTARLFCLHRLQGNARNMNF